MCQVLFVIGEVNTASYPSRISVRVKTQNKSGSLREGVVPKVLGMQQMSGGSTVL